MKEQTRKMSKKLFALLIILTMVIAMIPVQAFGAAKTYRVGRASGYANAIRTELSGKYFYTDQNNALYCSSTADGDGVKIATQTYGYSFGPILSNGSRVFYVYKDGSSRPIIYSKTTAGKSLVKYTATRGVTYSDITLLGVYNNKVYYSVGGAIDGVSAKYQLKCLNLSTKKVTTIKKTYLAWDKTLTDLMARKGFAANGRYIYGYKSPAANDSIIVYDCKTGKTITYGSSHKGAKMYGLVSSKLYYAKTSTNSNGDSVYTLYRVDGPTGKNRVKIFSGTSLSDFRAFTSTSFKYKKYDSDKWGYNYYKYTFADKTSTEITKEEFEK